MKDSIRVKEAEVFYTSFLQYTQSIFIEILERNTLDMNSLAEKIKILWNEIQYNRRFLLYANTCIEPALNENYIAAHSVRSTVIAIMLGKYFKLPYYRLLELGTATLLHDIGMFKLPLDTYLNGLDLTAQKKQLIWSHPMHSYKILQALKLPPAINLAVLEHHERENGSGYPKQIIGKDISFYGKIIAVACSYEALLADRMYKKPKDAHTGVLELIKNEGHQYDTNIIRALIFTFSIYPIGMFVLLSNGKQGRVFDTNPASQHHPFVQVLEPTDKGENPIVKTSNKGVYIARPLLREEIDYEKANAY